MSEPKPLTAIEHLIGEAVAQRATIGFLAAIIGESQGDKAAFLRKMLKACSERIEDMELKGLPAGRDDAVLLYAQACLAQTIGTLRGSPRNS